VSVLVSVLIPAHNEAAYIGSCLDAVFTSDPLPGDAEGEVLVLANGCSDETAAQARAVQPPEGWKLKVLEQAEGSKLGALNVGDAAARGDVLVYLDADVTVSPQLIPQLTAALTAGPSTAANRCVPRYASGSPQVPRAQSAITRAYARIWTQLPFFTNGVPGFGIFAMSRAGRQRWEDWPDIIADDIFARLNFAPTERIRVPATYNWPMVEGLRNLVRVRRRQNAGVAEIGQRHPNLAKNEDKPRPAKADLLRLMATDPAGFVVYALVAAAVKTPLFASSKRWTRGR
jgi:glycosyltransferase involved in cell wall biosynthesis